MNNSLIDDFLYKAKIMDTGEWIEGFVIKKQEFFYLHETLPSGSTFRCLLRIPLPQHQ